MKQITEAAKAAVPEYLAGLNSDPTNLYRVVVDSVEKPLLQEIMSCTGGNQSRAAQCLGINRATLRTKLKRHNLI